MKDISIITATYNSAAHIESCLASVVGQEQQPYEYLIIDGGSNDATIEIVRSYQKHYKFIKLISEKDQGIYDALNKGVKHATGEIIGFVHSDDLLADKQILSTITEAFQQQPVDGVFGDLDYVNQEDTSKIIRKWRSQPFHSQLIKKGWMPAHPTLFLKKAVYDKHGQFDMTYKIAADYEFMLRVLSDSSLTFSYVPKVFTKMRVGGASNRSLINIIQKSKEDWRAIKKHKVGSIWTLVLKNTSKLKQFF